VLIIATVITTAQLPTPSFKVVQVNETLWQAVGSIEAGYAMIISRPSSTTLASGLSYSLSISRPSSTTLASGLSYSLSISRPSSTATQTDLSYRLLVLINYGGTFGVKYSRISGIAPSIAGANRAFNLTISVWSPYGILDYIVADLGLTKLIFNGSLYKNDPQGLFTVAGWWIQRSGGWVNLTVKMIPSWGAGGTYSVSVSAYEYMHGYSDSKTFANLFTVVNTTQLRNWSFNKSVYFPNDPGELRLCIVYSGTDAGVPGETVYVNGTALTTDENGCTVYTFTAPPNPGTYSLTVSLAHGGTYVVSFEVSQLVLHVRILTADGTAVLLPSNPIVEIYNKTTGKIVGTFNKLDIPLQSFGEYLVRVWYRGILLGEFPHNQTQYEETVGIPVAVSVTDVAGVQRFILTNATLTEYSYDNVTRTLRLVLGGFGRGRLVYITYLTKPLYATSNTSVSLTHYLGEAVLDIQLPAEVTVYDPRLVKVTIANPFGQSFTPTILLFNGTTWIQLSNATTYEIPSQPQTTIKVLYMGIEAKRTVSLLSDQDIVVPFSYARLKDYKNATRILIANCHAELRDLSPTYPMSSVRIVLSGEGSFTVGIYIPAPPSSIAVTSNVTITWRFKNNWLNISGSFASIAEINVTDLYRLRIEFYDRLGRPIPMTYASVNEISTIGTGVAELWLRPGTYLIEVPQNISGFKFYGFFDGYRNTTRYVNISTSDVILKLWYRVPTKIVVRGVQVTSLLQQLFQTQDQYADVYIEGYVYDYYGNGVPNRVVNISLTNEYGHTVVFTARTDASGYFRTQTMKLVRGVTYRVIVSLPDDDTYIASSGTASFKPEELPTAPITALPSPVTLTIIATIIGVSATGVATSRMAKRRKRHFVTKKH